MIETEVAKQVVKAATAAVEVKREAAVREMRRAVSRSLHVKQVEETERDLADALAPVFVRQIESMAKRLGELEGKKYSDSQHEFFCDCGESLSSSDLLIKCPSCGRKDATDAAASLVA